MSTFPDPTPDLPDRMPADHASPAAEQAPSAREAAARTTKAARKSAKKAAAKRAGAKKAPAKRVAEKKAPAAREPEILPPPERSESVPPESMPPEPVPSEPVSTEPVMIDTTPVVDRHPVHEYPVHEYPVHEHPVPEAPELSAVEVLDTITQGVKEVIVGQDRVLERLLVGLLARGHLLLEGVPGLAKTLAMETLARSVGGSFARIQFTPDLLPADITGTRVWRASSERFDVELGPVFVNFLLADEINRAPAKVQSALLEVMAEHQVSIGGATYEVPEPFLVMATQNPIESEGVYPLPEAQRDRFLMKILIDYPSPAEEAEIVRRHGVRGPEARTLFGADRLQQLQDAAAAVTVDAGTLTYAVDLVHATRDPATAGLPDLVDLLAYGASPRATLGLVAAGKALALIRRRTFATPQDVFDVAPDVLRHRLVLSYEAMAQGVAIDHILARILSSVAAPAHAGSGY